MTFDMTVTSIRTNSGADFQTASRQCCMLLSSSWFAIFSYVKFDFILLEWFEIRHKHSYFALEHRLQDPVHRRIGRISGRSCSCSVPVFSTERISFATSLPSQIPLVFLPRAKHIGVVITFSKARQ
jgi:hypothetical protein